MTRAELIRAVSAVFEAGSQAADVIVIVRVAGAQVVPRATSLVSIERVGAFGDPLPAEHVLGMIAAVWQDVMRHGELLDRSEVVVEAVKGRAGMVN